MRIYNLSQKFSQIVSLYGNENALIFSDKKVTYNDLNILSDKVVSYLASKNLTKGDVVCVSSFKCAETFALIVACWKMGITYSFVDRFSPPSRMSKIIETCKPKLIIGDEEFLALIKGSYDVELTSYAGLLTETGHAVKSDFEVESSTIAYIMFTSGSTGNPNGVAISHGNLLYFTEWAKEEYNVTPSDIFSGANSHFFDNSVFDIYSSLLNGSSLLPLSREDVKNPNGLISYLEKNKVTIWFSVPSLLIYLLNLNSIKKDSLPDMTRIIFGGEGFAKNKLKELFDIFNNRAQLHNVYGPTECTCICSSYLISEKDFNQDQAHKLSPLGHFFGNFKYLILTEDMKLVKDGEIGELALGGDHVGKGYYGNPERTRTKYIQNPLHQNYQDIYYLTGDLAKLDRDDGLIHFCGRADTQVKFMGYRIELGEIEAALALIPEVRESAVTFGRKNLEPQITCFLATELNIPEVKKKLSNNLPSYMIPKKFIQLDVLPKNSNGKIDRKALVGDYYDKENNN